MASVLIMSMILFMQPAHAKGLKVDLTVVTNLVSQSVSIHTYQFGGLVYTHDSSIYNGITNINLQYPDDLIKTGNFQICIVAAIQACGNNYNSEEKRPENVFVNLFGTNSPQPVQQPAATHENTDG